MESKKTVVLVEKILEQLDTLVPVYKADPEDFSITQGFASVCIIDEDGQIYGKVWGDNKIRLRDSYGVAWKKANQVWITGYKTYEYEKLVYADKVNPYQFGINHPDFIGWEGGQPVTLNDGTKLSIGFSGFRGTSDIEIVLKAIKNAGLE